MDEIEQWAWDQFGNAPLGDQRRVRRAATIAGQMARQPWASLPQQMADWNAQRASYRFFDNAAITHEHLSLVHWERTCQQASTSGAVILMLQDFTDLDYSHHQATEGVGPLDSRDDRHGLMVHTTLAVHPDRRVLGVAYQQVWARAQTWYKTAGETKAQRRQRPDLQSKRWGQAVEAVGAPPEGVRWVHIADREGDVYPFLEAVVAQSADFCIRVVQNRRLKEWHTDAPRYLLTEARHLPIQGRWTIWLPARGTPMGEPAREAHLAVSWQAVTLRSPRNTPGPETELSAWILRTWEPDPPSGVEPCEWMVLTSVPVTCFAEAMERIAWYTCRWVIEEYHKCLKTGCRIEQSQLRHGQRLQRLLGVLAIVAVRLLQLRDLARTTPERPALQVVDPLLIQIVAHRRQCPLTSLLLGDFWLEVARLGGFPGRKADGQPGWQRLWRGWIRLLDLAEGVRLAQHLPPLEDVANP